MGCVAVVGLQYGDEGKGKIVDYLAAGCEVVVRGNGGANAGHTIVLEDGQALALHQIPSGISHDKTLNIIGNGCFVDIVKLVGEMEAAGQVGLDVSPDRLKISRTAHLVLPIHKQRDAEREGGDKGQGSTKAGIAFVAADKAMREGVRVEILEQWSRDELVALGGQEFAEAAEQLKAYVCDSVSLIQGLLAEGKKVLLEGAQAFGLDINHGKYPYTTSSDTTVAGLMSGTGVNYKQIDRVVGVAKATPSKVGGGVFVTAITETAVAERTRGQKGAVDAEYGATTGREREVGYLDLVALRRAVLVNGVDELALTKFDCLIRHGVTTRVAVAYEVDGLRVTDPPASNSDLARCQAVYEELPTWEDEDSVEAKAYIQLVEDYVGVPVTMIGNGPEREQLIVR